MNPQESVGLFGTPAQDLAAIPAGTVQFSPLIPGAAALEETAPASLDRMIMVAPPGTLERRYVLALSMRALKAGAPFLVMAPKAKGGGRIAAELESFGCNVCATSRRHHRIVETVRPMTFSAEVQARLDVAIAEGEPCFAEAIASWSQPGIFSWDRIDPGTALLSSALPAPAGRGADFGCGLGIVARTVLAHPTVTHLDLVDIDRRAIAAAHRNVTDARVSFHWADLRRFSGLSELDFVVMNPPFHDGGAEDCTLGEAFIRRAHAALRGGGALWLVANRHLPYESILASAFSRSVLRAEASGFKVYEATK